MHPIRDKRNKSIGSYSHAAGHLQSSKQNRGPRGSRALFKKCIDDLFPPPSEDSAGSVGRAKLALPTDILRGGPDGAGQQLDDFPNTQDAPRVSLRNQVYRCVNTAQPDRNMKEIKADAKLRGPTTMDQIIEQSSAEAIGTTGRAHMNLTGEVTVNTASGFESKEVSPMPARGPLYPEPSPGPRSTPNKISKGKTQDAREQRPTTATRNLYRPDQRPFVTVSTRLQTIPGRGVAYDRKSSPAKHPIYHPNYIRHEQEHPSERD